MNRAKYLNPFTDFGFKKLFGEEVSIPRLKCFLNSLLPAHHQIEELEFKSSEFMGRKEDDRRAIFDLYCQAENGQTFIVELQKEKQDFFKDRSVFYSTFPIQQQAQKGKWNFELTPVYCIGILDFCFQDEEGDEDGRVYHLVQLKNQENQVFYDKLTFVYLEMPNFNKAEAECVSDMDNWLYFLKNLEDFKEIPRIFMGREEFESAFEVAAIAKFTHREYLAYEGSLKAYRDLDNTLAYQKKVGHEEGREAGLIEGREEGLLEGREEGLIAGTAQGIEKGLELALKKLISAGHSEDEARAILGLPS